MADPSEDKTLPGFSFLLWLHFVSVYVPFGARACAIGVPSISMPLLQTPLLHLPQYSELSIHSFIRSSGTSSRALLHCSISFGCIVVWGIYKKPTKEIRLSIYHAMFSWSLRSGFELVTWKTPGLQHRLQIRV